MNHVFETMGTVVSIQTVGLSRSGGSGDPATLAAVERVFAEYDAEYSRYRTDSPATRIADGRLSLTQASEGHKAMYAAAVAWRNATGGAFDPHRADGSIDLAGIVKAAAIDAAGALLDRAGVTDWCINAGGDVLVRGAAEGMQADERVPWGVGIAHPDDRRSLLMSLALSGTRRAVATSGTSERGEHVWRSDPEARYRQVSVVADDIITADVLATAILAGGEPTLHEAVHTWAVAVVAVTSTGDLVEAAPNAPAP